MTYNEYRIKQDSFYGPLDLLLHLVKREEIDILDISIVKIADQFRDFIEVIHFLDLSLAGEFLVMATKLMEIKSHLLLPRQAVNLNKEGDPRSEIVRQLVEYKKFKDAVEILEEQAEAAGQKIPRLVSDQFSDSKTNATKTIQEVELWDLVSAFGRLMKETLATQPQDIVVDQTPMEFYLEEISDKLLAAKSLPFRELFSPPFHKMRLIGLFLALLELIKKQSIFAEQDETFGDIKLIWSQKVIVF